MFKIRFIFLGICFPASGESREGSRTSPDLPEGLSDGEHHLEEDEPQLIPHGESGPIMKCNTYRDLMGKCQSL